MNPQARKPLVIIQTYGDRLANCQRAADRRSSLLGPEEPQERAPLASAQPQGSARRHTVDVGTVPPPPPPMPPLESPPSTGALPPVAPSPPVSKPAPRPSSKPKAPPVPLKVQPQPPPCPTPDYDTLSLTSTASNNTLPRRANGFNRIPPITPPHPYNDEVDMESLESFKINHPASVNPKPPNTYFNRPKSTPQSANSSQNSTLSKKSRPVSVTIGEYPSGTNRRMPSKFNFLNGSSENDGYEPDNQHITSRLASELAQTLSRSNLRKRTESMENILNDSSSPKNGTVTISVNSKSATSPLYLNNNPHKLLMKSASHQDHVTAGRNLDALTAALANRVTIKVAESGGHVTGGILKSPASAGHGNHCSSSTAAEHKPLAHQKSITFGEITTVISDRPLHVT